MKPPIIWAAWWIKSSYGQVFGSRIGGLLVAATSDPKLIPNSLLHTPNAHHFLPEVTAKRWHADRSHICIERHFKLLKVICGLSNSAMFSNVSMMAPIIRGGGQQNS